MDNSSDWSGLWDIVDRHPLATLLTSALAICAATRLFTAYCAVPGSGHTASRFPVPTLPYWIPFLGHGPALALAQILGRRQNYLLESASAARGVCALNVFGKRCVVIVDPKLRKRTVALIHGKGRESFPRHTFETRRLQDVFGASAPTARKLAELASAGVGDVEELLTNEGFAKVATEKLARQLEHAASTLISKSTSWVDHSAWERAAESQLSPNDDPTADTFTVSAKLYTLITHFTVPLVCASLLSPSFIDNHEGFTASFLKFAANYERFSTVLPYWTLPGGGPAAWAREQCLQALESFTNELLQAAGSGQEEVGRGEVGVLRDQVLENVHPLLIRTVRKLEASGISDGGIACWLLSVVFEVAWVTSNAAFWALLLASRDQKSDEICRELSKSGAVKIIRDENAQAKFKEPTRVAISPEKLFAIPRSNALGNLLEKMYSTAVFADESYLAREDLYLDGLEGLGREKQGSLVVQAGDVLLFAGPQDTRGPASQHDKKRKHSRPEHTSDKTLVVLIAAILSLHRTPPSAPSTGGAPSATNVVSTVATPNVQGKQEISQSR